MFSIPTPWLDEKRGYLTDWLTQLWVKSARFKIDLKKEKWLDGPIGSSKLIGESFFKGYAEKNNLIIDSNSNDKGLVENFSVLDSYHFDSGKIDPAIIDFYENTNQYELDVWSEWSSLAKPFGWLLSVIFSKRLQQLNLPVSSLELSLGVSSQIISLRDEITRNLEYTGWLRKGIKTGNIIYAGAYTHCSPKNVDYECVKVVFPLPNGSATVILRPESLDDGSLKLHSAGNSFGDPGFYLLVYSSKEKAHVRYIRSFKETLNVYLDEQGELRTHHIFNFLGKTILKLHYRIKKKIV